MSDLGCEQEQADAVVIIKQVDHRLSTLDCRIAIHPQVREFMLLCELLDDVQHLLRLCEEQRTVPLLRNILSIGSIRPSITLAV